jgi:flavin reductase (DIM6/NTAB) family NADH-FMN oxidoreductase RutF
MHGYRRASNGGRQVSQPVDPQRYRALLARFATGVTVATTVDAEGKDWGMTASAVAAVSLDPPLLLLCVDRDANFHAAMAAGRGFALNILAAGQEHISRIFASTADDPFAEVDFHKGSDGYALLEGVVAHIVCTLWGTHEAGDHSVFFGTVTGGRTFDRPPLLHFRSMYTTIAGDRRAEG